jgi:hypothetical protein
MARIGNQNPTQSLIHPSVRSEYELAVEPLREDDRGQLSFQGSRYISFDRK